MTDPHVVVIGDVIDDVIVTPLGAIRPDTDTSADISRQAGGSAANAAAWLGRLGCRVDFFGHVHTGDVARHAELLEQNGVTPHLRGSSLPTGTIVVILQPDRTRTMLTSRGANALTSARDVDRSLLTACSHLHFTGYSVFGDGAPDAVDAFAQLVQDARGAGASVSVNPGSAGFIAEHGAGRLRAAMAGATVVLPNLDEGRALTGLAEPVAVVEALLAEHEIVVLTMGREGALAASRAAGGAAGAVRMPARPVTPLDTTGAGDAFGAALLTSLLRSAPPLAPAPPAPLVPPSARPTSSSSPPAPQAGAACGGLRVVDRGRLEAAVRAGIAAAAVAVTQVGARPTGGAERPDEGASGA